MDIFAHALYGATLCSRAGLAGGRNGTRGRRTLADGSVWLALLFGIMPDLLSMGIPFAVWLIGGAQDNFFHNMHGSRIIAYRYAHSLIVAFTVALLLRLWRRPLFIPALAWPLHIILDAFTHDLGWFRTTLFYPLTDWAIRGLPFWRHPEVVLGYWTILVVLWISLFIWRRRGHIGSSAH